MQNRVPLSLKTQSLKRDTRYVRYIEHIKHIKSGIKRVLFCAYLVLAFLSLSACEQQKQPNLLPKFLAKAFTVIKKVKMS